METVYAIYIGTTKIVGLKGSIDKSQGIVVETLIKVSSLGFQKGAVVDLEKAAQQVKEVVSKITRETELNRIKFHIILSNHLVKMFSFTTSVYFGDTPKNVTQADVDRVIQQTRATATIPLSESIILTTPKEFTINDLDGIQNPLDLEARRLAVQLLLFTVHAEVIKNLNKLFERLELAIDRFVPRIVTTAASVLRSEEMRDGIALVDLGGYTTTISYYHNQILSSYESLAGSGEFITDRLAEHLHISVPEARRLKEQYGSTILLERFEDEIIPVVDIFGKTKFNINKKRLYDQIHLAAKELAERIAQAIHKSRDSGKPVCGVVVTGGGVKLDGFLEMLQKRLGMTARLGVARNVSGHSDAVNNPAYTAQLGLLSWLVELESRKSLQHDNKGVLKRKMILVKEWIQENF